MFGLGNDRTATRLYLLLGCPLYVAGCIGIWPLGSMEPDATNPKYPQPVIYPTKDDCFEQGPGNFNDQKYYHDVLKFTGKRRSYVDIKFTDPDPKQLQKKIGIAFTLYADNLSDGTFFHYRAGTNHSDKINEVEVKLTTRGAINIRYWHCLSGTCYTKDLDIPVVLTTDTWYGVSLLREANGKLKWVAVTDVGTQQDETGEDFFLRDIPWNLNGDVRIGGRLDNPIGGFVGKLWCVGIMLNTNIPKCAIPPNSDKRPCNNVAIKFIWPLNEKSKGYEVIQTIHPVSPSNGMNFEFSNPIKGSLSMKTYSVQSQFKTRIHLDGEMRKRLTIALFVKPKSASKTWTIINVKPSVQWFYSELTVMQESTTIRAILKSTSGDVTISSRQSLSSDTWYFVAAQINWFWEELSLIVDDMFDSVKFSLIHSYQYTYSYLVDIKIGDDNPPPRGRTPDQVACIAIFNAPLEETSASKILEEECGKRKGYTAPVENVIKPIRIWPLGKRSYGYEVIEKTSMADPPDICWRFSDPNAIDPIDSEAVRFYGYDRFSLKIASTVNNLNSLTIGLFLKPEINISGTIIDVKFKSGSTTYTLSVVLNQMNISLKLEVVGASCSKLSDPVVIGEEVWTAVVIQSVSTSDFQLFVSDSTTIQLNTPCRPTTVTPPFTVLEIHVGKSADLNPTTGFRGSMRCLAMFNESLLEAQATDILRNGCDSANIVSRPGPVTSTTPILATIWKLDNDPPNGKRKSDMSKLESNTSLVFDGSSLLHVLVDINLNANMSLGLFIRPNRHPKGTILKSTSLPQLEVSIKQKTVYVSFDNSNTKCSTLEFHGIQPLYWHLLVIRRVPDCNSLVVTLNDEVQTTLGDCFTVDPNTVVPVRLGGETQSFNNFRGEMSCLAVFNQALPIDKTEAAMVKSCNEKFGNTVEVEEDGYDNPPNITTSKYRHIQSNAAPLDTTGILGTRVAKSLSRCTKLCNQQPYCRSFTLNKSSAECTMFNFITLDGLTSKADVEYYAVLFTKISVVK